jgi:hypothetical protein
VALFSS